jgi:phosphoribosylformylglycinamidine cyclo-ligase
MDYKKAGVDIKKAEEALSDLSSVFELTFTKDTLSNVGLFGGITSLKRIISQYQDPVLVQSIDGVGTKVQVAQKMNSFVSIGQDLVNHCVNDILCQGAVPLTFLDYFASSSLRTDVFKEVVIGMAKACQEAGCSLIGGETAEMPGIYQNDQNDLVGCITGVMDREQIIDGSKIKKGDYIIALPSNGLHTNGYSLARKAFFEIAEWDVYDYIPDFQQILGEELLRVHKSYLPEVKPLLGNMDIHGIAHITGGGIEGNIQRLLPSSLFPFLDTKWEIPPVFKKIQEIASVSWKEMKKVFNLGVGMVIITSPKEVPSVIKNLPENSGAFVIGVIRG